jgi:hypothetical protein
MYNAVTVPVAWMFPMPPDYPSGKHFSVSLRQGDNWKGKSFLFRSKSEAEQFMKNIVPLDEQPYLMEHEYIPYHILNKLLFKVVFVISKSDSLSPQSSNHDVDNLASMTVSKETLSASNINMIEKMHQITKLDTKKLSNSESDDSESNDEFSVLLWAKDSEEAKTLAKQMLIKHIETNQQRIKQKWDRIIKWLKERN